MDDVERLRAALLAFFAQSRRELPWREERDPYRVLVSEVMLQQTRAATVVPYFSRWMERFPDAESLADADEQEVLRLWQGLGYYARARNLHRCVREVAARFGGEIPSDPEALRSLPGIGPYTAGAVASIAFGVAVPAVDGNVRRVLARHMDDPAPSARTLQGWAEVLVDPRDPGAFNQALMELGSQICTPRRPKCGACPISERCGARQAGTQEDRPRPIRRARMPRVSEVLTALVLEGPPEPRLFLRRRPSRGLLGGMWELPGVPLEKTRAPESTAKRLAVELVELRREMFGASSAEGTVTAAHATDPFLARRLDPVDHVFSHRRVRYLPFVFSLGDSSRPLATGSARPFLDDRSGWIGRSDMDDVPLPSAQLRIVREILGR